MLFTFVYQVAIFPFHFWYALTATLSVVVVNISYGGGEGEKRPLEENLAHAVGRRNALENNCACHR